MDRAIYRSLNTEQRIAHLNAEMVLTDGDLSKVCKEIGIANNVSTEFRKKGWIRNKQGFFVKREPQHPGQMSIEQVAATTDAEDVATTEDGVIKEKGKQVESGGAVPQKSAKPPIDTKVAGVSGEIRPKNQKTQETAEDEIVCNVCGIKKPSSEFYKGKRGTCRNCNRCLRSEENPRETRQLIRSMSGNVVDGVDLILESMKAKKSAELPQSTEPTMAQEPTESIMPTNETKPVEDEIPALKEPEKKRVGRPARSGGKPKKLTIEIDQEVYRALMHFKIDNEIYVNGFIEELIKANVPDKYFKPL